MTAADERLLAALRAEHGAIYAYGSLGGHLDPVTVAVAAKAETAHRALRDALVLRFTAAGTTAPPAEPAYTLPSPVTDQAGALRLAVAIEERTAEIWRAALADTTGADRRLTLDGLSACAVNAARARRAAGIKPVTVAFPGRP